MTKNLRSINPSEHQIQAAIVEWARRTKLDNEYRVGDFLIKQANEGKRSWNVGKKMKKEGLTAGVSDLFLALPVKATEKVSKKERFFGGMWIEVKSKKGKLSYKQAMWITTMSQNYICLVVDEVDDGIQAIKDYLRMR